MSKIAETESSSCKEVMPERTQSAWRQHEVKIHIVHMCHWGVPQFKGQGKELESH